MSMDLWWRVLVALPLVLIGCDGEDAGGDGPGAAEAAGSAAAGTASSAGNTVNPGGGSGSEAGAGAGTAGGEDPAGTAGTAGGDGAGGSDSGSPDAAADAGAAGTDGDADTGGDASAGGDAGEGFGVPPGRVPMFVAQGHVGRTIVSCDDGQSWVADRSLDSEGDAYVCSSTEAVTCFSDGLGCRYLDGDSCAGPAASCDCDHHPGAANGIAFGAGYFVGTWGWGPPGTVRRSADGVQWEVVEEGTRYGGIAFGQDRFVTGDRQPRASDDGAATFQDVCASDLRSPAGDTIWNVRELGFADTHGGRFVIAGESGANRDLLLSSDGGDSWWRPTTLPPECAAGTRAIVGGGGVILVVHRSGLVCRSTDGGTTFTTSDIGDSVESGAVWTGERFMVWSRGQLHHSVDGASWQSEATTPGDLLLGPVAHNPLTGTLVGIRGGWQTWYDDQRFYRSSDGITWSELPASAYSGGHPMRDIAFGHGAPSSACPVP